MKKLWLGSLDGTANDDGLSQVVETYEPELTTLVGDQLGRAIEAIIAIENGCITSPDATRDGRHDGRLEKAQAETASLMEQLEGRVLPLLEG